MKAALPPDEEARLQALRRYEILDTAAQPEFDDIILLAAHICGTPTALITFLDERRQWFKAKIGLSESETPRDIAFCAHGILQTEIFIVADAQLDPRFANNPLVIGEPKIRFYAGVPLIMPDGHALGMLSVVDQTPRELNLAQKAALQALGRQVVAQLELRRGLIETRKTVAQLEVTKEELKGKTAFLEALTNSSIDGIMVVDQQNKKILQNQRTAELYRIPPAIADGDDYQKQLSWVANMTRNPGEFLQRVHELYARPDEISRDEIELKDGTILDRYSSPVIGHDGNYYGRIWTFRDITERKRSEDSLRLLGSAVEQSKESIMITSAELELPGPTILFVNPAFIKMTGYTAAEVIGKNPRLLQGPNTDRAVLRRLRENLTQGEVFAGETINYRKDQKEFNLEWQVAPLRNPQGTITHFMAIQRDITERKRFEARLFQSQKMETVGKLAGGIAHEFNSILTAIIGQSELLLSDLPAGSPFARNVAEISKAASRAATLTQQLLAYGRKQFLQTETLNLNVVLRQLKEMFEHIMGGNTQIKIIPDEGLKSIKADAGQIEQVILNLVVNAHEAMPNGGKLTLETANVSFNQESVGNYPELKPGDYVMLAISDTGTGMSAEVKARAFEPFFSTKTVGQGTGLGLSTCYGIAKQSGGHISIYSEPGRGTTFKIYLPQTGPPDEIIPPRSGPMDLPRGTETILVVEDDPSLRDMVATLLRRLGYTVLTAADGIQALKLKQEASTGHIDLLFTDMVLPHMSGKELAERMLASFPHTKILFTSAYTAGVIEQLDAFGKGVTLLPKPFTPSALALKVRATLDRAAV